MAPFSWRLVVCGINHKTSTIEEREPLQIGQEDIAEAHSVFGSLAGVAEATIVSTCNRNEFYFVADRDEEPFEVVREFYHEFRKLDIEPVKDKFYMYKGNHAARHLFEVASGIDSMVLGETQIMGQIKDAYSSACAVKTAGKVIHRIFHQAFRVAKQVRTDTSMGKGACSVSSVAVQLLKSKIGTMAKPRILFVGINKMITLAARNLSRVHHDRFMFANRTEEKAVKLASKYKAEGHSLDNLVELMGKADILISCTGSDLPVITGDMIDTFLKDNPKKQLLIVDLAIPRDVDIEKDYSDNIEVFDLEDIRHFADEAQKQRQEAIPEATEIIENRLKEFTYWYNHARHEPLYNGFKDTFENIRQDELKDIVKKLSPELREELDNISRRMVNRMMQVKIRSTEIESKPE